MLARKRNVSAAAILILLAGVQAQQSVTLSPQSLCVVTGSTIKISCRFTNRYGSSVTQREWYRAKSYGREQQDLSTDPQYSGRVYVSNRWPDCELTVRNVRVSDSGDYNFRFKTQRSDWISASSEVHLTVTDLKVTGPEQSYVSTWLSCITTCTLSNNPTYIWYKNGQRVTDQNRKDQYLYVSSQDAGSYSCAVRGHEDLRSPAVCVYDEKRCWSVTYFAQTFCSLIGSSVDIHSYYTFPHRQKVTSIFWFINQQADGEPVDLRKVEEYRGRVQYTQISQNIHSLRITNLRESDAQTYSFRFYTDDPKGKYTGQPGVSLSVTDLSVGVSDLGNKQKKLSCITTCTLSNNPTYIWYKNGQRVSDCKSASCSVAAVSGAVSYSCAVEGHDSLLSPPVYSPKNTSAAFFSSGDTVEGDSVTLRCSSDANPPVLTYSWFKQNEAADTLLTTGQNYSISNISSQHSGLYYCTAHNQLGQHNSTPTHLDVLYSPENTKAVVLPAGDTVEGDSVTLSCKSDANPPVLTYSWFRAAADTLLTTGQNYSISKISSQHSGLYYCTAHNQLGQHNSTPTHLDVLYAPRVTTVTAVPSVSGDSVTLLCKSDSNPISNYTWTRRTEEGVKQIGNGINLTLHSGAEGLYICTATNRLGSSSSSGWAYTSDNRAVKYTLTAVTVILVLILIAVILWMRRRASGVSTRSGEPSKVTFNENDTAPVYDNISAMTSDPTQTASSEDQDNLQYSTVFFSQCPTDEVSLYSTVQLPKDVKQEEEVEYATVSRVNRAVGEDEIYNNLKPND